MTFGQAISSGFQNYVNFTGRAARSQFWYWVLFAVLASIVASLIDFALFPRSYLSPINTLVGLALFLPGLAVSVRRLHDTDRTGWWLLLLFIPLIGAIILLVWFCAAGSPGPNRFGSAPLAGA
jgi:uncharacterized membrane protein YhaH (DUF805 family)